MFLKFLLPILFIFSLCFLDVLSQTHDNQLWSGVEIDIPITKKIEFDITQQIRLNKNIQDINWHLTDLGLSYSFNKDFKVNFTYRYKFINDDFQNVFYLNCMYDEKIWKIRYKVRSRYQLKTGYKAKNDLLEKELNEEYWRNRFTLGYDTDSWFEPYISTEIFYLFNNQKYCDRFSTIRYYAGMDFDTFEKQSFSLYLMYEAEFNIKNPNKSLVIGVFYNFKLPRANKY